MVRRVGRARRARRPARCPCRPWRRSAAPARRADSADSARFDGAVVHGARDGGAGDEIAAELRKDDAFTDGARLMPASGRCAAGRWRPTAALRSASTRSIAPMSMPSSSDDVATSAFMRAGLEQVLDLAACGTRERSMMRAHQRLAGQLVQRAASRSASRRLLTKISVERCARINSSRRGWIDDHIDGRGSPCDAGPLGIRSAANLAMSSTGTSMRSSAAFFSAASTMVTGR